MAKKVTNHTFITADGVIEFLEALEVYMRDHDPDLYVHLEISGDEKDVDGFEQCYNEECGLYEDEDAGPDGITYPNGQYM